MLEKGTLGRLWRFPVACFLSNVFLINKDVQTYVTSVRVARGLSANHWEIETRNS